MKKTVVTLSLLALALTGCTSGTEQSGGSSNPDSQVEQPPLPGETAPREQGTDDDADDGQNSDDNGDDNADDNADDGASDDASDDADDN